VKEKLISHLGGARLIRFGTWWAPWMAADKVKFD